jgi:uncharacterized protein YjhX (UPF0386 family)
MKTSDNSYQEDIFERLKKNKNISSDDPQGYRLQQASLATKALLVPMNNSDYPK